MVLTATTPTKEYNFYGRRLGRKLKHSEFTKLEKALQQFSLVKSDTYRSPAHYSKENALPALDTLIRSHSYESHARSQRFARRCPSPSSAQAPSKNINSPMLQCNKITLEIGFGRGETHWG